VQRRQVSVALVAALLVAGCGTGSKPVPKGTENPAPPTVGTTVPTTATRLLTPPATQPVADKSDPNWPPATATGGIKRIQLKAGEAITSPGYYFMDVPSGQVEGWQDTSADPKAPNSVTVTADHRWVFSQSATTYLASRESGTVYQWPSANLRLVTAGSGLLLFEEMINENKSSGWFRITDAKLKSVVRFSLPPGAAEIAGAVFAPDGKTVVISRSNWPQQPVYLVDMATGKVTGLKAPSEIKGGTPIGVRLYPPGVSQGVDIGYVYQLPPPGPERGSEQQTAVRRYSWTGDVISDAQPQGALMGTSADGRLYAWQERVVGGATNAIVVQDATSGKPLFRVLGGTGLDWTANGSGMLLRSDKGYYAVSTAGELRKIAPMPPAKDFFYLNWPQSSPADADLFAAGPVVYNGAGTVQRQATLGKPGGWIVNASNWSPSGKEVGFSVSPNVGKDFGDDNGLGLAPKVQRPPLADDYLLQVKDKAGECVNLREGHTTRSRVIQCLPTGTKLAAGDLSKLNVKANTPTTYEEDKVWMWVRTEKGEQGWVATSTGSIDWAD
jgi:hypothetical protein